MINPVDRDTIKAMTEYRAEQLYRDANPYGYEVEVITVQPVRATGLISSIRQSVGLSLMRAGARLAGIGIHTRIGAQV